MDPQNPIIVHPLQEDFEDFFENSINGFVITDSKGVISRANKKIAEWVNTSANDLIGLPFSKLFSVGSRIYYETHLAPLILMQGFFEEVVLEINREDGEKLRVMVNAFQNMSENGQPCFIRYTILKATDRLQYERNLLEAKNLAENETLKQSDIISLRDQFIAVLGHDLRNPLAAVSMAVDHLLSTPGPDEANLLGTIKRSNIRMMELVNNIMDFARTRLGQAILLSRQETHLEPILQQVVDEMKLIYPHREIRTFFDLSEPVLCDSYRIAQLLSNLTGNALTHGDLKLPVIIRAIAKEGNLELSISNKGTPIPKDQQERLFEPFKKEGHGPDKTGLGLGLYICAEIARAHDATLSFTSTKEETCFVFHLNSGEIKG